MSTTQKPIHSEDYNEPEETITEETVIPTYKITSAHLRAIGVSNPDVWLKPINEILLESGVDTKARINMFLAQAGHESNGFRSLTENLNYSAAGLANTWPNRYRGSDKQPNALALKLQRNPVAIANHTYANRMGNGPVESGDGWLFRGRGIFQLTGKDSYIKFFKYINKDLNPELLTNPEYAIKSAVWYWNINNLNKFADIGDVRGCTKAINGGLNGLKDRSAKYDVLEGI